MGRKKVALFELVIPEKWSNCVSIWNWICDYLCSVKLRKL